MQLTKAKKIVASTSMNGMFYIQEGTVRVNGVLITSENASEYFDSVMAIMVMPL